MTQVLSSWKNARGETIVEHDTGLAVLAPDQTIAEWLFARGQRATARQAATEPAWKTKVRTVVAEVETELAKPENQNVVATVDTRTGEVQAYMAAPGARLDPPPVFELSDAKRRQLELELQALELQARDGASRPEVRERARLEADKIRTILGRDGQAPGLLPRAGADVDNPLHGPLFGR